MSAMGQISLHFPFFSVQHLFHLFHINGHYFLIEHSILRIGRSCFLPGSLSPCETVFIPDQETVKEEKEHMSEFRERDRDEHDFSCQDVDRYHRTIIKPLMIGKESCKERGNCDQKDKIVVDSRDGPDPGQEETAAEEKSNTGKENKGQDIRDGFRQTPEAHPPGLIEQHIMPQQEDGYQDQQDMEYRCHDGNQGIGFPKGPMKGGETKSGPFPYGFLFMFYFHGGINPLLFLGQSEKLDELEYQS
jgi:hypothetical protein